MLKLLVTLKMKLSDWLADSISQEDLSEYYRKHPSIEAEPETTNDPAPKIIPIIDVTGLSPKQLNKILHSVHALPFGEPEEESGPTARRSEKKFTPVEHFDLTLMNNIGTWLSSSGQDGVDCDGMPIMKSTFDDESRALANKVMRKMLERYEKEIDIRNNGNI